MPPVKHATLSASGSTRWLNCPGSVALERKASQEIPDTSSVYAEEGTLAHDMAEAHLLHDEFEISSRAFNTRINRIKRHKLYKPEMDEFVEVYVDYCQNLMVGAVSPVVNIEKRVSYSKWASGGFGTNDFSLEQPHVIDVADLKYGKGVAVSAEDNSQLKLYGLGALNASKYKDTIELVRLHVIQPRLDSISVFEITAKDLVSWADTVVKPGSKRALAEGAPTNIGDWCKFCRGKADCPSWKPVIKGAAKAMVEKTSEEELVEIWRLFPGAKAYMEAVSDRIYKTLRSGQTIKGLKLVRGKLRRSWIDEDAAAEALQEAGIPDVTETKLKALTKIEKQLSKDKFDEVVGPHIIAKEASPSVALESAKGTAIGVASANDMFGEPDTDLLS